MGKRYVKSDGQSPSALACLLARVEQAAQPDPVIDLDLWCATVDRHQMAIIQAPFTASLDAALALCERVLPGWKWSVTFGYADSDGGPYYARVNRGHTRLQHEPEPGNTPALAFLAALLKALIASGQDGTTDRQTEPREDPDRLQPIKPKTHNHSGKGAEDVG